MTKEEIKAIADRLRDEHFAQAHTDVIGDEEERRGYLKGIADMERALIAVSGQASAGCDKRPR